MKDLIRFQFEIAKRWWERGKDSQDKFAQFFFYFSGFNALYFLWGEIGEIDRKPEFGRIENLVRKFDERDASEILQKNLTEVKYFSERKPVQRMDKRTPEIPVEGDPTDGRKWKHWLNEKNKSLDRLVALAGIIYIVRSNLVHGSKTLSGDDEKTIEHSITPLEALLTKALSMTKGIYPWVEREW